MDLAGRIDLGLVGFRDVEESAPERSIYTLNEYAVYDLMSVLYRYR